MASFDAKYKNLQMSPTNLCTSYFHFRDITILKFLPQKVGQGHGVQFSQLHHSMANVKIYKCLPQIFALALSNCLPKKGKSKSLSGYKGTKKVQKVSFLIPFLIKRYLFCTKRYKTTMRGCKMYRSVKDEPRCLLIQRSNIEWGQREQWRQRGNHDYWWIGILLHFNITGEDYVQLFTAIICKAY